MAEIVFLKKAVEDIRTSRDWYDEKEENLGRLFLEKVNESITSIAENPKAYPEKYRFLRAKLIRTFPYTVFYKVESNNVIKIYGCLHYKQDTKTILGRR